MSQPAIARLESSEHSPTFPALPRLSKALEIELAIDITPSGHEPQLISSRAAPGRDATWPTDVGTLG
jgi:transcriptional regulator with XRE-family HTH domain